MEELLELKGTNGILKVLDDCIIISRKSAMGFLSQGIKGDRTIFYKDIASFEFKKPTILANGYIQFIINGTFATNNAVGLLGTSTSSLQDPNTIILRAFNKETPILSEKVYTTIMQKMKEARVTPSSGQKVSSADELRKFKQLLDDGVINEQEFEKKKKELLG